MTSKMRKTPLLSISLLGSRYSVGKISLSLFTVAQDCNVSIIKTHSDIRHDQEGTRDRHLKNFPSRDFAFYKE